MVQRDQLAATRWVLRVLRVPRVIQVQTALEVDHLGLRVRPGQWGPLAPLPVRLARLGLMDLLVRLGQLVLRVRRVLRVRLVPPRALLVRLAPMESLGLLVRTGRPLLARRVRLAPPARRVLRGWRSAGILFSRATPTHTGFPLTATSRICSPRTATVPVVSTP